MGCNCGGKKPKRPGTGPVVPAPKTSGTTQSFALDLSSGQTLTFGSQLEADAENVRRGYTGRVRPLPPTSTSTS